MLTEIFSSSSTISSTRSMMWPLPIGGFIAPGTDPPGGVAELDSQRTQAVKPATFPAGGKLRRGHGSENVLLSPCPRPQQRPKRKPETLCMRLAADDDDFRSQVEDDRAREATPGDHADSQGTRRRRLGSDVHAPPC